MKITQYLYRIDTNNDKAFLIIITLENDDYADNCFKHKLQTCFLSLSRVCVCVGEGAGD